MALTGGCYCGNIRYEIDGEPLMRGLCHCRECQYYSGGAANVALMLPRAAFRYTQGEPATFARDDLENPVQRQFCPCCGTSLVSLPPVPDVLVVKAGTLDNPADYGMPDLAFFCADRQPFQYLPDDLPTFDGLPG